ncbi:MAG: di-trans,poly-cis-decaprenylcistransferase, partial [Alphaproteobacteria bacterium]|nr:di-trans,poly-cis-decaprenylcistransferase [Alphaproteobacteria bacterium]
MKSNLCSDVRLHVAIIMDGNGRWATRRGLPRVAGHRAGAEAIRRVVQAGPALDIGTLTLYAFSADNWRRPRGEVAALMRLFRRFLDDETPNLAASGIRISAIGRRDRLPASLAAAIDAAEGRTASGERLHLRVAIDYSAREAIVRAAACCSPGAAPTQADFGRLLAGEGAGEVDLLIRTGGEQRLSDFLLWESAYAELCFIATPWPEFAAADLEAAVA